MSQYLHVNNFISLLVLFQDSHILFVRQIYVCIIIVMTFKVTTYLSLRRKRAHIFFRILFVKKNICFRPNLFGKNGSILSFLPNGIGIFSAEKIF